MSLIKINTIAFVWGIFEATFFFIVPDVWLSYVVLTSYAAQNNIKLAIKAAIFTLIGALLGGAILFWLGSFYPKAIIQFLNAIPAINQTLIAQTQLALNTNGLYALILGGFQGVPYKIFAGLAANSSISFLSFLAISAVARMLRFIAVIALVRFLVELLVYLGYKKYLTGLLLIVWIIFYCFYFWQMLN